MEDKVEYEEETRSPFTGDTVGLCSRNSLDPYYLVPLYYLGHIPSVFGSTWVVGYQVVGVLRVPRIM